LHFSFLSFIIINIEGNQKEEIKMKLLTKMTVKELRMFSLMVSGSYEGKKMELVQKILDYQKSHLPILLQTEEGIILNPELGNIWDRLYEYNSFHKAIQM
jgi:hypothetical protein